MLTKQLNCKHLPNIQSLVFTIIGDTVTIELSIGSYEVEKTIPLGTVKGWTGDCNIDTGGLYNAGLPALSIPYIHRSIITGLNTLQQTSGNGRIGAYALILEHGIEKKYIAIGRADCLKLKKKVQSLPSKFILESWFPLDYWGRVISLEDDNITLRQKNRQKLSYQDNSRVPRS